MKKRLIALSILFLLVVGLGTGGLAKTNYFDDLYVGGDITVIGTVTFAGVDIVGDLGLTGDFTADGTIHSIDGSTSIALITAALNITGASFVTGDITQTGSTTITGDLSVDGTSNLDNTDIDGTFAADGTTATFGMSTSVISYTPIFSFGYDIDAAMTFTTTDDSGILAITHTGTAVTVTWTAPSFDFVGSMALDDTLISTTLGVDGTSNLDEVDIDGTTQIDGTVTGGVSGTAYTWTWHSDSSDDNMIWLDSAASLTITGVNATNALVVADGNVSITDDLDVDGTANFDVVDIDDAVNILGAVTQIGNYDITGNTTQSGSITLTGSNGSLTASARVQVVHETTTDVTAIAGYFSETISGTHGAVEAPTYGLGSYSKIIGDNYTGTDVYIAGAAGYYGILQTNSSVYPSGAVLGWLGGETISAQGAFVAVLGGDDGITRAGAAFTVRSTNSTPGTYFDYGLDLYSGKIIDYSEVTYNTADIRFENLETLDNGTDGDLKFIGDDDDGLDLQVISAAHDTTGDASLTLDADAGGDDADTWIITSQADGNDLSIVNHVTEVVNITSSGDVQMDGALDVDSTLNVEGVTTFQANTTVATATYAGGMYVSMYNIVYTQTASITIFTLPANADIVDVAVAVQTDFDGSGTDLLTVGTTGVADAYVDDLDIASASFHRTGDATMPYANLGDVGGSALAIKALYVDANNDASTGAATIYVYWTMGTPGAL